MNANDFLPDTLMDSLFNELQSGKLLEKILKESLGEELVIYLHLRADSSKAELEYSSGSQVAINSKKEI